MGRFQQLVYVREQLWQLKHDGRGPNTEELLELLTHVDELLHGINDDITELREEIAELKQTAESE